MYIARRVRIVYFYRLRFAGGKLVRGFPKLISAGLWRLYLTGLEFTGLALRHGRTTTGVTSKVASYSVLAMRRFALCMALLALSMVLCSGGSAIPLLSGASFSQVDFTYTGATQLNSQYGQVFLDYSQIPGSGYVNVVTSAGWVAQNMPVFGGSGLPGISMMFDLGFSGPQFSPFQAYVDYSPVPLPNDLTLIGSMQNFGTLSHVEHNAQGGPVPLSGAQGNPTGKMTVTFNPNGVTSPPVINSIMGSIEQDENQCGPSAVANSLAYLKAHYGLTLAHTHKSGINGVPDDSLVGQIDKKIPNAFDTNVTGRKQGEGVWRSDLLEGKLKYLDMFGPKGLIIKHQGTFDRDGAGNYRWRLHAGLSNIQIPGRTRHHRVPQSGDRPR